MIVTFQHPNLMDAARYVYENRLSKPYANIRPNNSNDNAYLYHDKVVHRPNHGLAHAIRTAFYVPLVVNAMRLNLPPERIQQLMLVRLFSTFGRENETSHKEDREKYNLFRQFAAVTYKSYVEKRFNGTQGYKKERIDFLASIIHSHFQNDEMPVNEVMSQEITVLTTCHNLDLLRCYSRSDFNELILEKLSTPLQLLAKKTEQFLVATGDRICGEKDYDGSLFFRCSTEIDFCVEKLKEVVYKIFQTDYSAGDNFFLFSQLSKAELVYRSGDLFNVDVDLYFRLARVYQSQEDYFKAHELFKHLWDYRFKYPDETLGLFLNQYYLVLSQRNESLTPVPFSDMEKLSEAKEYLTKLKYLVLPSNFFIDDKGLDGLIVLFPYLRTLDASKAFGYTSEKLKQIQDALANV